MDPAVSHVLTVRYWYPAMVVIASSMWHQRRHKHGRVPCNEAERYQDRCDIQSRGGHCLRAMDTRDIWMRTK